MPGTAAAISLLPLSETAVVVLQNSLRLCDVAGWISQAVIDTLFLSQPAQDYSNLVSQCIDTGLRRMGQVEEQLRDVLHGQILKPYQELVHRYQIHQGPASHVISELCG